MNRPRVLVIGATGLLGPYLMEASAILGDVVGAARSKADVILDVAHRESVGLALERVRPDILIHAAAMTDVDGCEIAPERAYRLNCDAVSYIVEFLPERTRLVYISTDQVYPDRPGPHREEAAAPVNVYAKSKLAGEEAALRHGLSLVLRTNVFGPSRTPERASLSDFVIGSLGARREITLFGDIYFSPLHLATVGSLLAECLRRDLTGVYNLGSRNGMSKKDFALAVASHMGLATGSTKAGVSTQIPGRAPRPRDMRMDVHRIEGALGMIMPSLREEISRL